MRKFLLFVPFVLFLVLGVVLYLQLGKDTQYMPSALIGKLLPEFTLVSLQDDQVYTKDDLPKGPYLINFWGTWCPACHVEHPFLMELAESGVPIIGIDYKDQKAPAEQWLEQKGNPYQLVLMDELGNFGVDMGVTGAPETFVVDSSGVVVYRHQGVVNAENWPELKGYMK
ncbi:cytochrome c biogenesis protein CcmG/thiol:disulfide interchange protein DsbE [Marinomonas alcarazii]|uniref:Cytochrome c biogenesis protein CcmG/thiol:disulfide interchange protein DsbE n=1 Tax=Marinomonas alcarazii TaxID=491949 RepID=A0A318UZG7_9GAMM|nr:DsbE family thiol:disulfide interchange protein [Marinomonas alcarazii]PYF81784.1 cytochrome c biogenesis protein CcmG/thiol:disulfide interchange protein DsbE [Marinomonas alcarazii]